MIEQSFRTEVVKCPGCESNIKLSIGRYAGGMNDNGGWILQCKKCPTKFPYSAKNPNDLSRVLSGAKVLDSWDDEVEGNKQDILAKYGLQEFPDDFAFKNLAIVDVGEYETQTFSHTEENIFYCSACNRSFEPQLYTQLTQKLMFVNAAIRPYINMSVKGRWGEPDSIIVPLNFVCKCGLKTKAVFYKKFDPNELPIHKPEEFILVDVLGANLELSIDGVFDRDSCLQVLQKLLIRWQVYFNKVVLAVPFIGFDFPKSDQQRVDLWHWILKNTEPSKTFLLTRKKTLTSFLSGASNTGLDVKILKEFGLLNPTVDELTSKGAKFKTDFHAKFYAGLDKEKAEVLAGSFNIHEGGYMENIHFKSYDFKSFTARYMNKMGLHIAPAALKETGEILFVHERQDKLFEATVEKYSTSRRDAVMNFISKL